MLNLDLPQLGAAGEDLKQVMMVWYGIGENEGGCLFWVSFILMLGTDCHETLGGLVLHGMKKEESKCGFVDCFYIFSHRDRLQGSRTY